MVAWKGMLGQTPSESGIPRWEVMGMFRRVYRDRSIFISKGGGPSAAPVVAQNTPTSSGNIHLNDLIHVMFASGNEMNEMSEMNEIRAHRSHWCHWSQWFNIWISFMSKRGSQWSHSSHSLHVYGGDFFGEDLIDLIDLIFDLIDLIDLIFEFRLVTDEINGIRRDEWDQDRWAQWDQWDQKYEMNEIDEINRWAQWDQWDRFQRRWDEWYENVEKNDIVRYKVIAPLF